MKILFVAAEGAPFSKTGGLGDVIGALPKSLVKHGHQVGVILPYYDMTDAKFGDQVEDLFYFEFSVGWRRQYVGVKRLVLNGVSFYFIDNQHYFFRGHVCGDFDDGERFAYFQLAAVELMERIDFIPDVLHVHDYHTAMIPFLVKEKYHWIQAYRNIKTVLTIHNLEFQGQFPDSMLWELFGVGYERYADGTLRWNDCLNWMKAGILYADRVTTVSPSYAGEIRTPEFGCNLDQILRMESGKLVGIVNGIDTEIYNPETDPLLAHHFDKSDLSGKLENKRALQERVGLPVRDDVPLVGIVSRLTRQKGFDLVVEELHNFLQQDVQNFLELFYLNLKNYLLSLEAYRMNENKKWGYIYDKKLDMYIPNLPRFKKFTSIIFILLILSILSGIVLSFLDLSSYDKIKIFVYNAMLVFIFLILWIFLLINTHYTEKILQELNELEVPREFEIKALKRRIIPQIIMTVIILISMFAFEQKKLSFDYLFKLILVIGICAFIFYRSLRKFQNSKYSLYIKGNTVKIFYENNEKEIITTENINYVSFFALRRGKRGKERKPTLQLFDLEERILAEMTIEIIDYFRLKRYLKKYNVEIVDNYEWS